MKNKALSLLGVIGLSAMLVAGCGTNDDNGGTNGDNGNGNRNGNTVGTRSIEGGRNYGRGNTNGQFDARNRTGDAGDDARGRLGTLGNDARDRMGNLGNDVQGLGESGFGVRGLADQLGLADNDNVNGGRRSGTSPNGDDAGSRNGVGGFGTNNTGNYYTGDDAGNDGIFGGDTNRSGIVGYGTNGTTDLYGTARTGGGQNGSGAFVGLMIGNTVVVADNRNGNQGGSEQRMGNGGGMTGQANGSAGLTGQAGHSGSQSNKANGNGTRIWKVTDRDAIAALNRIQRNMNGSNPKAKASEIARDIGYVLKHVKPADQGGRRAGMGGNAGMGGAGR